MIDVSQQTFQDSQSIFVGSELDESNLGQKPANRSNRAESRTMWLMIPHPPLAYRQRDHLSAMSVRTRTSEASTAPMSIR